MIFQGRHWPYDLMDSVQFPICCPL